MNVFVFIAALMTAIVISAMLSANAGLDPVRILISALAWIGAVALVWHQWVKKPLHYFGRVAAFIGVVILSFILYKSLPSDDLFVVCTPGCPPRAGTFWPLVFQWAACIGLASFAIWGTWERFASGWREQSPRTIAWEIFIVVWTIACATLLVQNTSVAVLAASGKSLLIFVGSIAGVIGGVFLLIYVLTLPSRRRSKREAEEYGRLQTSVKRSILNQIDSLARRAHWQLVYRRDTDTELHGTTLGRVGGRPLMRVDAKWPSMKDGTSGIFLFQVPLSAPRLPDSWRGRVLSIFIVDYQLEILSLGDNEISSAVEREPPSEKHTQKLVQLEAVAVPFKEVETEDDEENTGFDTQSLLELDKGFRASVAAVFSNPKRLLALLLNYSPYSQEVSATDAIVVGGAPALIQQEHEATCSICNKPMRFLLQFCDVTDEQELGDSGVGYVYGCDQHTDQILGFLDSH